VPPGIETPARSTPAREATSATEVEGNIGNWRAGSRIREEEIMVVWEFGLGFREISHNFIAVVLVSAVSDSGLWG